ncbi:MAG: hypothetical protein ACM3PS_04815, partial [Syntrophothermus sp.]
MKDQGSRTSNADGKLGKPLYTLLVVSLIAAFVFASLPMSSAFAAPVGPGGSGSGNGLGNSNRDTWEAKVRNLRAELSIINNLQTKP